MQSRQCSTHAFWYDEKALCLYANATVAPHLDAVARQHVLADGGHLAGALQEGQVLLGPAHERGCGGKCGRGCTAGG